MELELGRLALSLGRLQAAEQSRRRRAQPGQSEAAGLFLATSIELLSRVGPAQRPVLVDRLCLLAQAANLGIIGLEEWFETDHSASTTSDRHIAVNVSWEGSGGATSSSGRL